ncbi:MAG TPA: adenylate kinase [Spirochaetota bacterium]|nr:adenylate kinase [Spirochaetota bacterium]
MFGPNGSGKGTQGAIVQKMYNVTHVESGGLFRDNIKGGTELGKKAKEFIDRGDLVPDSITIPMILDRLKKDDCKNGWLLDGFPRNPEQAEALKKSLDAESIKIDYVIEISLDREIAKKRIMGRRLCENDNNHPNNIFIDAIKPKESNGEFICRVCGGKLSTRADDQDENAINKRHEIYYDTAQGTMAAVKYFKKISRESKGIKFIELDGTPGVGEVSDSLKKQLI